VEEKDVNFSSISKEITPMPDPTFPINIFYRKAPGCIPMNWHDHLELVYVISGKAILQIDDSYYSIESDDFIFINSHQIHATWEETEDTQLIAIVFNDTLIRNNRIDSTENRYILPILNKDIDIPNLLERKNPYLADIRNSLDRMLLEFVLKGFSYELQIKSELYRIVSQILRYLHEKIKSNSSDLSTGKENRFADFLAYLQKNINLRLPVNEAAKRLCVSPNHFCRIFKQQIGMTYVQYCNLLQVQEAERLLSSTDYSISEITEYLGFGSLTHFERVFRKYKMVSPTAFRSKYKTSDTSANQPIYAIK
jgi:AraC family transcriptional activator of pobA